MSDRPVLEPDGAPATVDAVVGPPHEAGTVLRSRYRLTHIVGRGGMGNVYRAEDLRLPGRLCAIKEVTPEPHLSPGLRRQAQRLRSSDTLGGTKCPPTNHPAAVR